MVGWKSLFRSLSGKAAKEEVPAPVHELLDTSWSGKDRTKYFDSIRREGSRGQHERRYDGSTPHHSHHRPSRPPRHTLGQVEQPGAGPVAVCSRDLAARLENLAQQPCEMSESEETPPSPRGGVQRSGSAPQCILSSGKRPVEGGDSANSIHGPMPGATEEADASATGAAGAATQSAGSVDRTGPDLPTTHLRCRTTRGPQQQHPVRRPSHGQLSAALSECAPAGSNNQATAGIHGSFHATQHAAAVVAGSPEGPSRAILSTLSRSMPSSRDASVHGGQGGLAGMAGGDEAGEGGQHQQRDREGSVASGSGRPASRPLPCSREGSQHGQRNALGYLAALPPGDPAGDDVQLQTASMPARGAEDLVCSPGAVSLLSLQLRGMSVANSVGASREGSYRPLTRQLSAGGLSVALSREGSNRAGSRNPIVAAHQQHWSSSGCYPRSREASGRDRSAYLQQLLLQQQQAEPEGWPLQGLPSGAVVAHSREDSSRGGFEGADRGYMSREGSLHPVAEAEPHRAVHPPLVEGGSWTRRITSYPTAAAPGAVPVMDRSGSRRSNGSSRRQDARVKQQAYAVDPTQLTAALSALALSALPAPPPPDAAPAGDGSTSQPPSTTSGGSEHGGRKSVLVGDPEWATQEGECLEGSSGLPDSDLLTVCPSEVRGSQQVQQGAGRWGQVAPAENGSVGSGEEEAAAGGQPAGSSAHSAATQQAEHGDEKKDWNRKFIRRWKAVKKRARIQAMGLRSLWKVNSPSDVHIPDELLVDLPQNDLAGQRFWHSPPRQYPGTAAGPTPSRGLPVACRNGSRTEIYRDPSLSTMLFGEVAEVT